jgi:hypothetical protein
VARTERSGARRDKRHHVQPGRVHACGSSPRSAALAKPCHRTRGGGGTCCR